MYGKVVMLRCNHTNLGVPITMVALKFHAKGKNDFVLTILVGWRLGPYADPDQQGDSMSCAHKTPNVCSALQTDRATDFCVELLNMTGAPSKYTTYPDILFCVCVSFA